MHGQSACKQTNACKCRVCSSVPRWNWVLLQPSPGCLVLTTIGTASLPRALLLEQRGHWQPTACPGLGTQQRSRTPSGSEKHRFQVCLPAP